MSDSGTRSGASGEKVSPGRPVAYRIILLLFFLSGASGLVYQVVWLRKLTLVFGTTTFAVSSVLSSFMAGLGLGSYLSGRFLARRGRSLILFGGMECGVGLYALVLPRLLSLLESYFAGTVGQLGLGVYGESLLKLVLTLAVLIPPTSLMGATLPLLVEHTVERFSYLGVRVGTLYSLNTFGAVVGCAAAGFVAIPALGILGTTLIAAGINLTVGMSAVALGVGMRRRALDRRPAAWPEEAPEGNPGYSDRLVRLASLAFAISGFASLGLEVVWTRLIHLTFTSTTYAFTIMLTVMLAGIAAGSLIFGPLADRSPDPLRLFGRLEVAIGLSVMAFTPLFLYAWDWVIALAPTLGGGWVGQTSARFAVGFALLIVPTLLFGATFPVVSRVAARGLKGLPATIGRLYAANVVGGIAGAFFTGFVLIPLEGTDQSFRILSGACLIVGLILVVASPRSSPRWKAATALAAGAAALTVMAASPLDLSRAIHETKLMPNETLAFYKEGVEGTVMVAAAEGGLGKRILVTGTQASTSQEWGRSINRLQGVLPFLFERTPRKVLAICFGTGTTFGTVAQFDVEQVRGVEISPQVIAAAPHFALENYGVLHNPRFRLQVDDGRNFLLKSRDRYDAITMEPMHPGLAGVVNFYTREFYALCRARLATGGVVSQWVPLYQLSPRDVRMLYRTFAESFPHALVFFYRADTFMLGSDRPLDLSVSRLRGRLRSEVLARDLASIALDSPERLVATLLMGREAMLRFAGDAPVLSDDSPIVEFTGPKAAATLGYGTIERNVKVLFPFAERASLYLKEAADPDSEGLRRSLDAVFYQRNRWAWQVSDSAPRE